MKYKQPSNPYQNFSNRLGTFLSYCLGSGWVVCEKPGRNPFHVLVVVKSRERVDDMIREEIDHIRHDTMPASVLMEFIYDPA